MASLFLTKGLAYISKKYIYIKKKEKKGKRGKKLQYLIIILLQVLLYHIIRWANPPLTVILTGGSGHLPTYCESATETVIHSNSHLVIV